MNKSVNITNSDRYEMVDSVSKDFYASVESLDEDADFYERLLASVAKRLLSTIAEHRDSPLHQYLHTVDVYGLINNVSNGCILPKDCGVTGCLSLSKDTKSLLVENTMAQVARTIYRSDSYEGIKKALEDVAEPGSVGRKFIDISSKRVSTYFTPEEIAKIATRNETLERLFRPLQVQLKVVVNTLQTCKTTKQFEERLPDLTRYYTGVIRRKLAAAGEKSKSEEESEKDSLLAEASNTLALAALVAK